LKQKVKIVHVYKDFDIYNGFIDSMLLLAKYINHDKYELNMCLFQYSGSTFGQKFENLGGKIYNIGLKWKDNPLVIFYLTKYFKTVKPDIVQTHVLKPNLYGRIAARMAGVPIIIGTYYTLKDTAFSRLRRVRDQIFHPINSYLNKLSDKIVVISHAIRREWDPKLTSKKFELIYSAYTKEKLITNQESLSNRFKDYFNNSDRKKIGAVSRLSEEKGIKYLIDAMPSVVNKFPDIQLFIVGSGKMENVLKEKIMKLNLENI